VALQAWEDVRGRRPSPPKGGRGEGSEDNGVSVRAISRTLSTLGHGLHLGETLREG